MASPKGREVNWNTCDLWQNVLGTSLSLGGWGCEGRRLIGLSTTPISWNQRGPDGLLSFHFEPF